MKNTDIFFESIKTYRDSLQELEKNFAPLYNRLAPFKDSQQYASRKKAIDEDYASRVAAIREIVLPEINKALSGMETTYSARPAVAPTDSQLRLLQALKLREGSISKTELEEVANSVAGCPSAEAVVEELGRKSGHFVHFEQKPDSDTIRRSIAALRRGAEKFVSRVDHVNDETRRQYCNGAAGDYDLFRMCSDHAVSDKSECLRIFGSVTDSASFCAAVDGNAE